MVTSIGLPPDLEPEVMTSQRSSLWGAWLRHAGWAVAGVGTVTGRAKPRGGLPGGNVSQGRSAALGGGGWQNAPCVPPGHREAGNP